MSQNRIERIFSFTALLLSIISIFLAWQSNYIAKQQSTPKIIVLYVKPGNSSLGSEGNEGGGVCDYSLRLANVGGSNGSIVGYRVTYEFNGNIQEIEGDGAYTLEQNKPLYRLSTFSNWLLAKESLPLTTPVEKIDDKLLLNLPLAIDAGDALDIYTRTQYLFRNIASTEYSADEKEGFLPVEISYTFKLANGDEAISSKVPCFYFKQ